MALVPLLIHHLEPTIFALPWAPGLGCLHHVPRMLHHKNKSEGCTPSLNPLFNLALDKRTGLTAARDEHDMCWWCMYWKLLIQQEQLVDAVFILYMCF